MTVTSTAPCKNYGSVCPYSPTRTASAALISLISIRLRKKIPRTALASAAVVVLFYTPPEITRAIFALLRKGSVRAFRLLVRASLLVLLRSSTAGFLSVISLSERTSEWRLFAPVVRSIRNRFGGFLTHSVVINDNFDPSAEPSLPSTTSTIPLLPKEVSDQILNSVSGFSFSGCAWLVYYHLGVVRALLDAFGRDRLLGYVGSPDDRHTLGFGGTSSGSLPAAALVCGVPFDEFVEFALSAADDASTKFGGPVGRMSFIVRGGLERFLPDNAGTAVAHPGRLVVSVTSLRDLKPSKRILTGRVGLGRTKEELISVLMASCYIPLYYETPPLFWDPSEDNEEDVEKGEYGHEWKRGEEMINHENYCGDDDKEEEEEKKASEVTPSPVRNDTDVYCRQGAISLGLDGGVFDLCPAIPDRSTSNVRRRPRRTVQVSPYHLRGVGVAPTPPQFHPRSIEPPLPPSNREDEYEDTPRQRRPLYDPVLALLPGDRARCEEMIRDGYEDAAHWIREEKSICVSKIIDDVFQDYQVDEMSPFIVEDDGDIDVMVTNIEEVVRNA